MMRVNSGKSSPPEKKSLSLQGALVISFIVHAIVLFFPSAEKNLSTQIILESKKSHITFINYSEKLNHWDIVKPLSEKDPLKGDFPMLFKKKKKPENKPSDLPAPESFSREEAEAKESYERDILKKIHRMKYYPQYARRMGMEGEVTIRFTLDRSGRILNYPLILKKAGHDVLNRSGVLTITQAAPFPSFPEDTAELMDTMTFVVTIDYNLRVN